MSEAVEKIRKATGFTVPEWILTKVVDNEATFITDQASKLEVENLFGWAESVEEATQHVIYWSSVSETDTVLFPENPEEVRQLIFLLAGFRKEYVLTQLISHYHNLGGTWDEDD